MFIARPTHHVRIVLSVGDLSVNVYVYIPDRNS